MLENTSLNSTEKVIWLLKRLGEAPFEIGLTELANEMGHAKSGIYKTLSLLIREGLVYQCLETKKYRLGPTLHRLGMMYNQTKGLISFAEPIVKEIAVLTKESINVGLRQGDDVRIAYCIESPLTLRLSTKLGKLCPINAGSVGKLMAAYSNPEGIAQQKLQAPLVAKTPNTIVDPQVLLQEYENIRRQGYATSHEEHCLGATGIAAPIFNYDQSVSACLNISGPTNRFTPEKMNEWILLILEGANEISRRISFNESHCTDQSARTKKWAD